MPVPVPGRMAEAIRRSTVQVRSGSRSRQGSGSGAVIQPDAVITNAHVIRDSKITVESWDGKTVDAFIARIDGTRDLAILRVPGLDAPLAPLGDSDGLRPGMPVFAVGHPLGFIGAVSSGVVHALASLPSNYPGGLPWVQSDLRLAPGNSGGPLANFQGQIVGINTMVTYGGLALAVPSRSVQEFLTRKRSASLGVVVHPVPVERFPLGLLILELTPGGAAESASLIPGDILVTANDQQFRFITDLKTAIEQSSAQLLRIGFYRGGQQTLRHVTAQVESERARSAA